MALNNTYDARLVQQETALGAGVLAVDLSEAGGRETEKQGRAAGQDIVFQRADVTREADVAAYVGDATRRWGTIDIFMNNAGWQGPIAPISAYSLEDFQRVMAINVGGVFLGLKHVLPVMTANGRGAVRALATTVAVVGGGHSRSPSAMPASSRRPSSRGTRVGTSAASSHS